jgi:hypothetical protein
MVRVAVDLFLSLFRNHSRFPYKISSFGSCRIAKSIAMSIAWRLQSVISAFTSALAGGLIMARAIYNFCSARNITFFGMVPNNHEESYIDELLSYIFAAAGFYFQFKMRFDMPFPFNLLLWPLGTFVVIILTYSIILKTSISHSLPQFHYRIRRDLFALDYYQG